MSVAGYAGTHHISPDVLTTAESGHDMVNGQIFTFFPAVLTGIVVTVKHFHTGQAPLRDRPFYMLNQAYD